MMLCAALSVVHLKAAAQDLGGIQNGNFGGIHAVLNNPAHVAQSKFRWDFNVLTFSQFGGSTAPVYGLSHLQYARKPIEFVKHSMPNEHGNSDIPLATTITGPSLMWDAGVYSGMAVTTRLRMMGGATNGDNYLLQQWASNWNAAFLNGPHQFTQPGQSSLESTIWGELGVTYGVVMLNTHTHYLKLGVTGRYLGGLGSGYFKMTDVKGTINSTTENRPFIENTTGKVDFSKSLYHPESLSANFTEVFNNRGWGGDVGFIYEFRPPSYRAPDEDDVAKNRDIAKYRFRLGASLLDVGNINFERDYASAGEFYLDINNGEKVHLDEFAALQADSLRDFMIFREDRFTPAYSYDDINFRVRMPTRLQADVDVHIKGDFFVNLQAAFPIQPKKSIYKVVHQYPSQYVLTPRLEGKRLGVFMPISLISGYKPGVGLAVEAGPFFAGSSNLLSLARNKGEFFHAFAGLRFYGLQHSKMYWYKRWYRKVNRWKKGKYPAQAMPYGY